MIAHPGLASQPEGTRLTLLYVLLRTRIVTTLNSEISEDDARAKMTALQSGARKLDNAVQIGPWKYEAADGVLILGFGAKRVSSGAPVAVAAAEERAIVHRGNALACRERTDMERVIDVLRRVDQVAYMELVAELLLGDRCTQINRGSQVVVLERYSPKDIARVRPSSDTTAYWINAFYIQP